MVCKFTTWRANGSRNSTLPYTHQVMQWSYEYCYLMSSYSPSGGMKLMLRSDSNLLSLTHCSWGGEEGEGRGGEGGKGRWGEGGRGEGGLREREEMKDRCTGAAFSHHRRDSRVPRQDAKRRWWAQRLWISLPGRKQGSSANLCLNASPISQVEAQPGHCESQY